MKNPFPGMNPFMEQRWGDLHGRLTTYITDYLNPTLPKPLRARMLERVYVEDYYSEKRKYYVPDVHVYEPALAGKGKATAEVSDVAVAEPLVFDAPVEIRERFIHIIDYESGGAVVTVIELVSPSNRLKGPGRDAYQAKQQECIAARVNLVEIDLVRVGEHVTLANPSRAAEPLRTDYHISVLDFAKHGGKTLYYPCPLRDRLPRFRIPLREADDQVVLDLQSLVDQAFERAYYDDIDFTRALRPPLSRADAEWAQSLLSAARK